MWETHANFYDKNVDCVQFDSRILRIHYELQFCSDSEKPDLES